LAIYCDAITWTSQGKEARRSNDTLAEMFGVTSRAISKAVARMVELGFVDVEVGPNNIRSIKPRTTVHLNKRSPRTSVHPEQLFTTPLNNCSPQHGTTVHGSPEQLFIQVNHIEEQREEHRGEQKGPKPKKESTPKDLQTVIDAFVEAGQPADMGEAFFNYYESIGWRVGKARTPMKDWKASARGWIQRETKYQDERNKSANRARGHGRSDVKLDAASTLEWLKSPRRSHGYY
jgi:hypothetical protein